MANQFNNLSLVPLSNKELEFVRFLRNDPRNSHAFVDQSEITMEAHAAYMKDHMSEYFICYSGDEPAGFVGVVSGDIRLAVSTEHRKRGVAKFMIAEIGKVFPSAIAKIKIDNYASMAAFESAGFKKTFYIYTFQD